jgi:hypothetical protein
MKWALALLLSIAGVSSAADKPYRGTFAWGPEVEAFQPCGTKYAYWVVGDEKLLQRLRDRTETLRHKRGKPYQPIYIEAVGEIDTKSEREGFAEDYRGLFRLREIKRVSTIVPKGCEPRYDG